MPRRRSDRPAPQATPQTPHKGGPSAGEWRLRAGWDARSALRSWSRSRWRALHASLREDTGARKFPAGDDSGAKPRTTIQVQTHNYQSPNAARTRTREPLKL